jgi:hypothetical protein
MRCTTLSFPRNYVPTAWQGGGECDVVTTPIRTIREMSQDVHMVRVMSEEVTHFGYFLFSKNENQIQIKNQFPGIEKVVTKSKRAA